MKNATIRWQYTAHATADSIGNAAVSILGTKYIPGGQSVVNAPLWLALLDCHETDAHFAMYTTPREVRCLKADTNQDVRFEIAAFDLDFEGHQKRPGEDDLTDLIRALWISEHTPNIVYPTRGGARIIFNIEPIYNPDEFEGHFQALLSLIAERTPHWQYKIDPAAKDWTRLFRAPRVIRRDEGSGEEADYWDTPVYQFHTDRYDLRRLQPKPRLKRQAPAIGQRKYAYGVDRYIVTSLRHVAEGNRNRTLFRLACYALERYEPESAEKWLDHLRERFGNAGMSDREMDSCIKSARRTATTDHQTTT